MNKTIYSSRDKTVSDALSVKMFKARIDAKSPLPEVKVNECVKKTYIGPPIPSLKPNLSANVLKDTNILYKSLWGSGKVPDILECPRMNDKMEIRNILCRRKYSQKEEIKKQYLKEYSDSLIACIEDKTKNIFQHITISLLYYSSELDAYLINRDHNIDTNTLIEILCTRSRSQIILLKASYIIMFNKHLITDIRGKHSESFESILKTLLDEERDDNENVDIEKAKKDAAEMLSKRIFNYIISDTLIPIFCKRSYPQLLQTFKEFKEKNGYTFYHYIKRYSKSNYNECLKTIYCFCINPIRYFSKKLHQGIVTNSINQIVRIVVTRCEKDLLSIIKDYKIVYHTSLLEDILKTFPRSKYHNTIETIFILIEDENNNEIIPYCDDELIPDNDVIET